jgi:hypothetical protein
MRRLVNLSAELVVAGAIGTSAHATPYEVVVLKRYEQTVIQTNMETGAQRLLPPVPLALDPWSHGPYLLAADVDGAVFVVPDNLVTELAYLPRGSTEWQLTAFPVSLPDSLNDMDVLSTGQLFVGGELNIYDIDPRTGEYGFPDFPIREGPAWVAAHSSGASAAAASDLSGSDKSSVYVRRPGVDTLQQIDADLLLGPMAFESEDTLLAFGFSTDTDFVPEVYRVDLQTGETSLVLQDDALLAGTGEFAIDPHGRLITLKRTSGDEPAQLLRIDLAAGTTDVVALDEAVGHHDLDIRIIPEPPAVILGVWCLVSALLTRHRRARAT